jgi:hypothetical protein
MICQKSVMLGTEAELYFPADARLAKILKRHAGASHYLVVEAL